MTVVDFVRAAGPRIAHVTARANRAGIHAHGLRSGAESARAAGLHPHDLVLRKDRRNIGTAVLNHQRPILHGLNAAQRVLDGHTAQSWAIQLDERVFFWPHRRGATFARSIARDTEIDVIWIDAAQFARQFFDHIDLAALNTGNFTQGGAHAQRGDWIYQPLSRGLPAFRTARKGRGLVKSNDGVREISLRCAIPAKTLAALRL